MALPEATLAIKDGALGIVGPNNNNIHLKVGAASGGNENQLYAFADGQTLKDTLGSGPLVEAVAFALAVAGGTCLALKVKSTVYGTASAVTTRKVGTATLAVTLGPIKSITLKIILGGALGTMTYQVSLDGGTSYQPTVYTSPVDGIVYVPGTFTRVTFLAGTYVANDTYSVNLEGTTSRTGSGPAAYTAVHSPADHYTVDIILTAGGTNLAAGTAAFKYSVDDSRTFSAEYAIPTGTGRHVIAGTGLVLTWTNGAGTSFVKDDEYSFTATGPDYTLSDLNTAIDAALADPTTWFLMHVVGIPANISAAASIFSALDTKMTAAEAAYRYTFAVMELPDETDANIKSNFLALASTRVAPVPGFSTLTSPVSGALYKRPAAWSAVARAAATIPSEDLGRVASGPLKGITLLFRDEAKTPTLHDSRFTTLRTHVGKAGFYCTAGRILAAAGSDFQFWQHRRVMDIGSSIARSSMLEFLNDSVRVYGADQPVEKRGRILEEDARAIEARIEAAERDALTRPGYASDVSVLVDRQENILSTQKLKVKVRIVPLGYAKTIEGDIGFLNPALTPV